MSPRLLNSDLLHHHHLGSTWLRLLRSYSINGQRGVAWAETSEHAFFKRPRPSHINRWVCKSLLTVNVIDSFWEQPLVAIKGTAVSGTFILASFFSLAWFLAVIAAWLYWWSRLQILKVIISYYISFTSLFRSEEDFLCPQSLFFQQQCSSMIFPVTVYWGKNLFHWSLNRKMPC